MTFTYLQKKLSALLLLMMGLVSLSAFADGGIVLGGTRLVYPAGQKQISLSVRNTSPQSGFLVQSWVENANGKKTNDFVVTPPLFVSNAGDENVLRLMYVGATVPTDRETLYYFNAKAVPSIDKSKIEGSNSLILATVTRIKLFVRPANLAGDADKATSMLKFERSGDQVKISNPSPYYITLVKMTSGNKKLADVMVAPFGHETVTLPKGKARNLAYSTINDYGAISSQKNANIN
ncbi:fimbria/pilus periplasmic chaperone [Serratia fonticola]|uniref:fimbria/pilus periplasmic chaperone n=1 Tax=Serratia fonticola TaxID=47917 RepID=UPI00164502B1|nr:fimbria/pilus periplasmic chaperone [Serratia fonticola]MBC3252455.1 fimbria/pilus periplasmic chaperone [Serratia fonticola]